MNAGGAIAFLVTQFANTSRYNKSGTSRKLTIWDYIGWVLAILFISGIVLGFLIIGIGYTLYCFGWFH